MHSHMVVIRYQDRKSPRIWCSSNFLKTDQLVSTIFIPTVQSWNREIQKYNGVPNKKFCSLVILKSKKSFRFTYRKQWSTCDKQLGKSIWACGFDTWYLRPFECTVWLLELFPTIFFSASSSVVFLSGFKPKTITKRIFSKRYALHAPATYQLPGDNAFKNVKTTMEHLQLMKCCKI